MSNYLFYSNGLRMNGVSTNGLMINKNGSIMAGNTTYIADYWNENAVTPPSESLTRVVNSAKLNQYNQGWLGGGGYYPYENGEKIAGLMATDPASQGANKTIRILGGNEAVKGVYIFGETRYKDIDNPPYYEWLPGDWYFTYNNTRKIFTPTGKFYALASYDELYANPGDNSYYDSNLQKQVHDITRNQTLTFLINGIEIARPRVMEAPWVKAIEIPMNQAGSNRLTFSVQSRSSYSKVGLEYIHPGTGDPRISIVENKGTIDFRFYTAFVPFEM